MTLRRGVALAALLSLALVVIPAARVGASGGGGCGEPVTSESGTKIAIEGSCFTPTVLYAEVGDTVTWTNLDGVRHNVAGANLAWGSFEGFRTRRPVGYSFASPGVYSYVCTVHPGMVGTVVVGDPGPGDSIGTDEIRRVSALAAAQNEPVRSNGSSNGAAIWLATATIVAGGGLLVAGRVRRRSRPAPGKEL